jgi:hypothetical protein
MKELPELATDYVDYDGFKLTGLERAAIRAINIPTWKPYIYEHVSNGVLIVGCLTTTYKKGKRKGSTKFLTKEENQKVIVTPEMQKSEGAIYL